METTIINTTPAGLRELLAVPESGTAREQIVYIDVADLEPDPRNFYSLSDIEGLMDNISLFGVQQPLRVRADPMDPDKWIIVSGHRRREAVRRLVEDGREDLREVPCIIETQAGSEALQELRLIYANSDTRKLTGAEISSQAERVEALLYQLKEEGFDFPGRMRDHVAEACKVSKSKLSRLKVIRDRLAPALAAHWEKGLLNEAVAYAASQIPEEDQNLLLSFVHTAPPLWQQWQVDGWRADIQRIRETESRALCGLDSCAYQLERIQGRLEKCETMCARYCCIRCGLLPLCRRSCPHAAKAKAEKQAEQEAFEAEQEARKAQRKKEDQEEQETLTRLWKRVGEIWRASGVDKREAWMVLNNEEPDEDDLCEFVTLANSPEESVTAQSPVPILPYSLVAEDLENLCGIADFFHCSLDYLLGRTDKP